MGIPLEDQVEIPGTPRQAGRVYTIEMRTSISIIVAIASCIAFGLESRADNLYHVADAPGQGFDEKFAACVAASVAKTPDLVKVHIDWTGVPWVMTRPIDLRPASVQLRVKIVGDDVWNLIEYRGPAGTKEKRAPIFRFWGLKESTVTGVKIVSHSSHVVGFDQATDYRVNSASSNEFKRCRLQAWDGTVGSIGFRQGYSSDKKGVNDHSYTVFDQCDFFFAPSGSIGSNLAWGVMDKSIAAGHRGFVFQGYNTVANSMRDCTVTNAYGITTKGMEGQDPAPWNLDVTNFSSSGSPIVFDLDIGSTFSARGGRHELGGCLMVAGFPQHGNGNDSHIDLTGITCDDFLPNFPGLGTIPGSMVSAHDWAHLTMTNVVMAQKGLGDQLTPGWLSLWCNAPARRPVVTLNSVVVSNGIGDAKVTAKNVPVVKGGTWRKVVDGRVLTVAKL